MSATEGYSSEEVDSAENFSTTKFLECLFRYDYVYRWDCEENSTLNLSEKHKSEFLQDCSKWFQGIDERKASRKLRCIREIYSEESDRLQKASKDAEESKYPWFSLADKLFRRASTSTTERTSISQTLESKKTLRDHKDKKEKLTFEETARSISEEDLMMDNAIVSKYLPFVPRKSQSLPSSFQTAAIGIPTVALYLSPPIPRRTESLSLKRCTALTSDAQTATPSISPKSNERTTGEIGGYSSTSTTVPSSSVGRIFTYPEVERSSTYPSFRSSTSPSAISLPSHSTENSTLAIAFPANLSPIFTRASSPSSRICKSSADRSSISPAGRSSISPAGRSSISPAARSSISPAARSSISPAGISSLTPTNRLSISPAARSSTSPVVRSSKSSADRSSISPGYKSFLSPVGRSSISPVGRSSISPVGRSSISPGGRSSISPVGRSSLTPAARSSPGGRSFLSPSGRSSTSRHQVF